MCSGGPVYKVGGKDPLTASNCRDVALTSVIAKVLEFLVLQRLQVIFLEAGILHCNQTAYQKAISCTDDISTQEVIAKYTRGGSWDLQKAFDSVEYSVILERLLEVGINGKLCQRLLIK